MNQHLKDWIDRLRWVRRRVQNRALEALATQLAPYLERKLKPGIHIDGVSIEGDGVTISSVTAYGDGEQPAFVIQQKDGFER